MRAPPETCTDDLDIRFRAPLRIADASLISRATYVREFSDPRVRSARFRISRVRAVLAPWAAFVLCSLAACSGAPSTPAQRADASAAIAHADFPSPADARAATGDSRAASTSAASPVHAGIGFRSREQLDAHFAKHGSEFGEVTRQEYLREAQLLRDAPTGGAIEEIRRPDGTISRYDRASGAFIAFDADGTIRTFFKPNDGEAYFRRQALRSH